MDSSFNLKTKIAQSQIQCFVVIIILTVYKSDYLCCRVICFITSIFVPNLNTSKNVDSTCVFLIFICDVSISSDTTTLMLNVAPCNWRCKALYQYLIILNFFLNLLVQIITLYSSFQSTYIIMI